MVKYALHTKIVTMLEITSGDKHSFIHLCQVYLRSDLVLKDSETELNTLILHSHSKLSHKKNSGYFITIN